MNWSGKIGTWLSSRPIQLLCRLTLGTLFVYASLDKIVRPREFALILTNYRLLPSILVPGVALFLPWLELTAGFFLISGLYARSAALWLSGLLMLFMLILGISALRGLNFDCGCFSTLGGEPEPPLLFVLRDLLFLVLGAVVVVFGKKGEDPVPDCKK